MEPMVFYIGIDVHKDTYTLCTFNPRTLGYMFETTIESGSKGVLSYVQKVKKEIKNNFLEEIRVETGYEAGPTGFGLKRDLDKAKVPCHILAPTKVFSEKGGKYVKTDIRDARDIARILFWGAYKEVKLLDAEDEAYRDYIRMRDDRNDSLKRAKQCLLSFLMRRDAKYPGANYWTGAHMKWLREQKFANPVDQLTFNSYLAEVLRLIDDITLLDERIEQYSTCERYSENVSRLKCFAGIDTHIAMCLVTEIGDFSRFESAEKFSSYLGLTPGQHSSGKTKLMTGITKAGNCRLRKLLCESANAIKKCNPHRKSKRLMARQAGMDPMVVEYADRGSNRIKRKFRDLQEHGKHTNQAKAAGARELSCFIWGMMTNNMGTRKESSV